MSQEPPTDRAVRIGDLQSLPPGSPDRLVAVGLGSCVGVAVFDEVSGAHALAHVFLPECPLEGPKEGSGSGTYADRAIPALVASVREQLRGGSDVRLFAVVAGGSQMFGTRPGSDVGARNAEAVLKALDLVGIPVHAQDLGGTRGRTMRVSCIGGMANVVVRVVGGAEQVLWGQEQTSEAAAKSLAA